VTTQTIQDAKDAYFYYIQDKINSLKIDRVKIKHGHMSNISMKCHGDPKYVKFTFSEKKNSMYYSASHMRCHISIGKAYFFDGFTKFDNKISVKTSYMKLKVSVAMDTLKL
jgi:hypothetical protein